MFVIGSSLSALPGLMKKIRYIKSFTHLIPLIMYKHDNTEMCIPRIQPCSKFNSSFGSHTYSPSFCNYYLIINRIIMNTVLEFGSCGSLWQELCFLECDCARKKYDFSRNCHQLTWKRLETGIQSLYYNRCSLLFIASLAQLARARDL